MSDQDNTIAAVVTKLTDVSLKVGNLDGHYQSLDQRVTEMSGNVKEILDKFNDYIILTHSHATILANNKDVLAKWAFLSGLWDMIKVMGKWAFTIVSGISAALAAIWSTVPQWYDKITHGVHNVFVSIGDIFR